MSKILIIDDQPCVQEFLAEELVSEGYRVVTTGDAESVSGYLKFSKPDLVVLDLYLNGPDGIGVLHNIKRRYPNLPVLIFTAYDSYRDDPQLSQADGYMIKSMVLDELKAGIAGLLNRQETAEQSVKTRQYCHNLP
jgi:two-component system response regulator (stage 0 sporulation protein F)